MKLVRGLCRLPVGGPGFCPVMSAAGSCPFVEQSCAQEDFKWPVCWWVGLCSCSIGCLAWNILALKPTGYWVGLVLVEEWRPPGGLMTMSAHQSCCCQCHFPCSESQPLPTSKEDPPVLAGRSFPVFYEITAFFPWVLMCTRLCVHPPRVEFLFPLVLQNSCGQTLLGFKVRFSESSSSCCQILWLESLLWGSGISLL